MALYSENMKKIRITAVKKVFHEDLAAMYENPLRDACPVREGDVFISSDALCPEGFCQSAWHDLYPYIFALASGGGDFFDGWMKNPYTAVISCNDGVRPVSFLLETVR